MTHADAHRSHRAGWLRAAVLGANDGIVSTASLIIGIAAAGSRHSDILLAGMAGLVAGAMSMAAGEYVSVSSQSDLERADLEMERRSLEDHEDAELEELASIYQQRGLDPELSRKVAEQLHEHDALAAHARDDIGISEVAPAKPVQAALYSAATFTIGAAMPLLAAWLVTAQHGGNQLSTWCGQLGFGGYTGTTYGGRDVSPPKGRLFGCTGYDESTWHWCDWQDGNWRNEQLDYHYSSGTEITSLSCSTP